MTADGRKRALADGAATHVDRPIPVAEELQSQ